MAFLLFSYKRLCTVAFGIRDMCPTIFFKKIQFSVKLTNQHFTRVTTCAFTSEGNTRVSYSTLLGIMVVDHRLGNRTGTLFTKTVSI